MGMKKSSNGTKPKHKRGDLVFLVWADNTCYSRLSEEVPAGVTLDLAAGMWMFERQIIAIGSRISNPVAYERGGNPIGVYDRTSLRHLSAMKSHSEWVRDQGRPLGDD